MLLWPVALLNYLDRQMLAAMKFSVMGDVPSIGTEAHWGVLPAAFKWVYAGLSPIGGYLADRYSKRRVIAISLCVWSMVTWMTGHVTTFNSLLITRALMGISEAFYIPAALALIAEVHPGATRSRAVGIHQMAIYVGVMIGGFSGYVAESPTLGWRWAFSAAGLAGIAYSIPLYLLLRRTQEAPGGLGSTSPNTGTDRVPVATAARELLSNGGFLLLVLCFTLPALPAWIVKDWMPAILKQQFHIGQGKAGVSATLYVNIASLTGAVLGGWLADRWMRTHPRGRIFISATGLTLLIPALFGVGNAPSLAIAIAFLALFGIGWGFFDGNNMPILCQIVRPQLRATAYGVMNLVSISCGGFADWGFGTLRDHKVPLNLAFGAFALGSALSVVCMLLIKPRQDAHAP